MQKPKTTIDCDKTKNLKITDWFPWKCCGDNTHAFLSILLRHSYTPMQCVTSKNDFKSKPDTENAGYNDHGYDVFTFNKNKILLIF